jgi:hypothetical protein
LGRYFPHRDDTFDDAKKAKFPCQLRVFAPPEQVGSGMAALRGKSLPDLNLVARRLICPNLLVKRQGFRGSAGIGLL